MTKEVRDRKPGDEAPTRNDDQMEDEDRFKMGNVCSWFSGGEAPAPHI